MDVTYGSVADTAPEGFLPRRIHFNSLVELDTPTKEGVLTRFIESAGFGVRELPLPVTGLGPGRGHENALPGGRLDMVKISGSKVEGWAWLLDDPVGQGIFRELATGVVRGNSIEMTDVRFKLAFLWDEEADLPEIKMNFTEANVGATTFVMKPAFGGSKGEIDPELTAALAIEGDLEVTASFSVVIPEDSEITAATTIRLDHAAMTMPEPDHFQPVEVSADGALVSGHLGQWGTCHTGLAGTCTTIPRSRTNYSKFCTRKFHTDEGVVYTGPIILLGGHDATREAINKAMANVENAWADVVVTDGVHGPWMCGVVRPGITPAALHAATGSRVSGHWLNGELFAICSVNAGGFEETRATEFTVEIHDGEEYLAASYAFDCGCGESEPESYDAIIAAAAAALEDEDGDDTGQEGSSEDAEVVAA